MRSFIKRFKLEYSPQSQRALESLRDPKWSWNRFPRKQINTVMYAVEHPVRSFQLHFGNLMDRLVRALERKIYK